MALKILDGCTNCDICEPQCPNEAISYGGDIYEIEADLCTECVGFYAAPTCMDVCPVDCIVIDSQQRESTEQLEQKYRRIYALELNGNNVKQPSLISNNNTQSNSCQLLPTLSKRTAKQIVTASHY